jgi:hypothetical protein
VPLFFYDLKSGRTDGPLRFVRKEEMSMCKCKNDAPRMRGCRARNEDGHLRAKRGDTRVGTIEKQYGVDLGVRADMRLDTYLNRNHVNSLNDLITGR